MKANLKAYLMLTLCAFFWSGNFIVGKFATLYQVPPLTLNFFRWLIVWIILIPFTFKDIFLNIKIIKEKFYSILLMSITSISIFNSIVYYSLNFTQVLNGALMISTIPVLIIFISHIFRVEKINLNQVLGLIFSITGVVIIITQLEFSRLIHLDLNKGDLWLLVAMLSWAIYSIMLKTHKTGLNYLTFISVIVTLGLIFLFPQFLYEYNNQELIKFNFAFILIISYVVLFAGLGAYIFYNKAVLIIGPSRAGIFLHLMPAFSSFMAIFLLNEKFMNFHIFGATATFLGSFLLQNSKILSMGSGVIIIFFGIYLLELVNVNFLNKSFGNFNIKYSNNLLFPFIVGLGFGFGWTPCIGPILGSILAFASMEDSIYKGILLLSFYSLGLAVPFVFSSLLIKKFLIFSKSTKNYLINIKKISGIILIITGILIVTGKLQILGFYLIEYFPILQKLG